MSYASVCILSYNRPDFLRECVASLYAHAGAPFELIIHDDGSAEQQTYKLLGEMAGLGATVVMNKPGHNQGVGTAINRMFKMASGDPLIKVDQDLIFHPWWLRDLQKILAGNRDANRRMEPQIGLMGLMEYHHEPVDVAKTIKKDYGYWREHTHILGSAFALTREAWDTFGPLEEHSDNFGEDWNRMKEIEASELMVNALPPIDLCFNRGMGVGPSTVVESVDEEGVHTIAKIHHGPYLHPVEGEL